MKVNLLLIILLLLVVNQILAQEKQITIPEGVAPIIDGNIDCSLLLFLKGMFECIGNQFIQR